MTKTISVLGSTGSIGTQTLKVIDNLGGISVRGISANTNVGLLEEQARKYSPALCVFIAPSFASLSPPDAVSPAQDGGTASAGRSNA